MVQNKDFACYINDFKTQYECQQVDDAWIPKVQAPKLVQHLVATHSGQQK
jgi:hypothetical protein